MSHLHPHGTTAVALGSVLLLLASCSTIEVTDSGRSSGTWVMTLDERPFIVLSLTGLNGTLSRPATFSLDAGGRFSQISSETRTTSLNDVEVEGSRVHFSVVNPNDPGDPDTYEFNVTEADRATLKPVGIPFEVAWPLERVPTDEVPQVATDWEAGRVYTIEPAITTNHPEMAAIYAADQAARQQAPTAISPDEWQVVARDDTERRARTRALLDAGQLHTGEDFRKAAFVFQHGGQPGDYLLAHTLALVAASKGDASATWIAAATLDRYLQSVGQPQIYGTQFLLPDGGAPATQAPYDRDLISDLVRRELGVPAMAAQQDQLEELLAASAPQD